MSCLVIQEPDLHQASPVGWEHICENLIAYSTGFILMNIEGLEGVQAPRPIRGSRFELNGRKFRCTSDSEPIYSAIETEIAPTPSLNDGSIDVALLPSVNSFVYAAAKLGGEEAVFVYSPTQPDWDATRGGWYKGENRALVKFMFMNNSFIGKVILERYASIWEENKRIDMIGIVGGNKELLYSYSAAGTFVHTISAGYYYYEIKGGNSGAGGNGGTGGIGGSGIQGEGTANNGPSGIEASGSCGGDGGGISRGAFPYGVIEGVPLFGYFFSYGEDIALVVNNDGGDGGNGGNGGNGYNRYDARLVEWAYPVYIDATDGGAAGAGGGGGAGGNSMLVRYTALKDTITAAGGREGARGEGGDGGNGVAGSGNSDLGEAGAGGAGGAGESAANNGNPDNPTPEIHDGQPGQPGGDPKSTTSGYARLYRVV